MSNIKANDFSVIYRYIGYIFALGRETGDLSDILANNVSIICKDDKGIKHIGNDNNSAIEILRSIYSDSVGIIVSKLSIDRGDKKYTIKYKYNTINNKTVVGTSFIRLNPDGKIDDIAIISIFVTPV